MQGMSATATAKPARSTGIGHWHPIDDIPVHDAVYIEPMHMKLVVGYIEGRAKPISRTAYIDMPHYDRTYRIYESDGDVHYSVWWPRDEA